MCQNKSSMSEELFVSVNQLMERSQAKGSPYDHVVIESSGISEPKSVRSIFQDAESYGVPLMSKVRPSACTLFSLLLFFLFLLFFSFFVEAENKNWISPSPKIKKRFFFNCYGRVKITNNFLKGGLVMLYLLLVGLYPIVTAFVLFFAVGTFCLVRRCTRC